MLPTLNLNNKAPNKPLPFLYDYFEVVQYIQTDFLTSHSGAAGVAEAEGIGCRTLLASMSITLLLVEAPVVRDEGGVLPES